MIVRLGAGAPGDVRTPGLASESGKSTLGRSVDYFLGVREQREVGFKGAAEIDESASL